MPRETLEREIGWLQDRVLAMGNLVENALQDSMRTLKYRDMKRGRRLIADDRVLNERRYHIERDVLSLIATQRPIAGDLHILATALVIATELERIGDYAKGVACINQRIREQTLIRPLVDLPAMAAEAQDILHAALDAFVQRDAEMARAVSDRDRTVDDLYRKIYRDLVSCVLGNPHQLEQVSYLLWAAHNFERAADRATNICERVVFAVTGEIVELGGDEAGTEALL